jgi:hypothetical protein
VKIYKIKIINMDWTPLSLKTFVPQIPKVVNDNFKEVENFINSFYDEKKKVIIQPINTKGRIKGASGEFVSIEVDNLTVKNQFTNLLDNNTTADYDYYKMIIDQPTILRDPCTAANYWPVELNNYKVIDVNKPYYKITNAEPIQLHNENLSQVVGLYLDSSLVGADNFTVLLNAELGTQFVVDPSDAGQYVELIATSFDPSWGYSWEEYKTIAVGEGTGGGGGTDTYDPVLDDSLEVPDTVGGIEAGTTVGDLRGKTFTKLWNELLFPTVLASYSSYSISLTGGSSGTMEVGSSITPTLTANYNPGSITNGGGTAGPNLKGDATKFEFSLPNGSIDYTDSSPSSNTQSRTYTSYNIGLGNNRWLVEVDFAAGTGLYYDNKGNPVNNLDSYRDAGNGTALSANIIGSYRGWWGTGLDGSPVPNDSSSVRALTNNKLLDFTDEESFNIIIPAGYQEVYFYIPAGKNVDVLYVETNVDVRGTFALIDISINDAGGTPQAYEAYTTNIGGTGYASDATYKVTIT